MNYLDASVEEVVEHVLSVTSQSVSQMLTYHKNKGHTDIVNKIIEARKRAAKIRLLKKLESFE